MKTRIVFMVLSIVLFCSTTGYGGQWGFFEHRYEYQLEEVIDADRFVEKEKFWEAYKDNQLVGYVFLSKDWTEKLVGYSGKHMETLIGMDNQGVITGVKLLYHSEPIVLIGLKEDNYLTFMKQYPHKNIRENMSIGKEISIDAITGATVTAVVQNAIILRSARSVALKTGLLEYAKGPTKKIKDEFTPLAWEELLQSALIKNIVVPAKVLGIDGEEDYLDLYFGLVTVPSIGRNVLGETLYQEVMNGLKEGESAIFIVSKGEGSFKGSGFARGGVFDRINIEQEDRVYVFRDKDYRILTDIQAEGAPVAKEGGVFIVRDEDFQPTRPFQFNLVLSYRVKGKKEFRSFNAEYAIPDRFLE